MIDTACSEPHHWIYPPVAAGEKNNLLWYSVQIELPLDVEAGIEAHVAQGHSPSRTVAIHGALYGYRSTIWSREALAAELHAKLKEGLDDADAGRSVPDTPEFWKKLAMDCRAQAAARRELEAAGKLGNLLLPHELYDFIKEEIDTGKFSTPTEVVCAAMPYLRPASENT